VKNYGANFFGGIATYNLHKEDRGEEKAKGRRGKAHTS
jgi:hypothetical protein